MAFDFKSHQQSKERRQEKVRC